MKEALRLAGKLAIAARYVTLADAITLSQRIIDMEVVLDEYDDYIISLIINENT